MPTNLPPEYYHAEDRFREATTPQDKVDRLRELISTIPKHKGTERLRGMLKKRLARLKDSAQSRKGTSRQASAFSIGSEGAGQVAVIGPANTGKSSLVAALTNATPEIADYPYTTWTPTPGMMEYDDVQVQLIDTPPLDADHVEPELINLIRRADLLLLVIDLQGAAIQGLEDTIAVLRERRIVPEHLRDRHDDDERIMFVPLLVVVNKCDDEDLCGDFEVLRELLGTDYDFVPVSALTGRNALALRRAVFEALDVIRVYSKPPNQSPDMSRPFVLPRESTVEDMAAKVHQDFFHQLKSARVWGSGAFDGQMVGRDHVLEDGDVVELRM
jgi:ribosome-interacting GTPase 1